MCRGSWCHALKALDAVARRQVEQTSHFRQNNYLYIGAPGTGKTRSEFYNILHQLDRNHVIVDVKGSMASLMPLLEQNDYHIYYLNLMDLHRSMYYNPLAYIRKRYSQTDHYRNLQDS